MQLAIEHQCTKFRNETCQFSPMHAGHVLVGSDEARSDELECFVRSSQACQNHHSTTVCSNHLCTKPHVQQKLSQSSTMPILSTVHAMLAMSWQAQMRLVAMSVVVLLQKHSDMPKSSRHYGLQQSLVHQTTCATETFTIIHNANSLNCACHACHVLAGSDEARSDECCSASSEACRHAKIITALRSAAITCAPNHMCNRNFHNHPQCQFSQLCMPCLPCLGRLR